MAKRKAKIKVSEERAAELEADRLAAYGRESDAIDEVMGLEMVPPAELEVVFTPDPVAEEEARHEGYEDFESAMEGDVAPMEGEGDEEPDPERNSVVKAKFKHRYIENATALGVKHKAARRSNWDWLSQQLATFCLNEKGKIEIGSFIDVLDANGVDHSRWTNKNKGWEGRFRMTGRVALQKIVANAGQLKWPGDLEASPAPSEWCARYKTKES